MRTDFTQMVKDWSETLKLFNEERKKHLKDQATSSSFELQKNSRSEFVVLVLYVSFIGCMFLWYLDF
jgi:hypothetical protein